MENESPNLSISDLLMLQNIVSVACQRGAFRAEEMSGVGQCYDRLSAWLATMAPANSQTQDQKSQGE